MCALPLGVAGRMYSSEWVVLGFWNFACSPINKILRFHPHYAFFWGIFKSLHMTSKGLRAMFKGKSAYACWEKKFRRFWWVPKHHANRLQTWWATIWKRVPVARKETKTCEDFGEKNCIFGENWKQTFFADSKNIYINIYIKHRS